SPSTRPGAAFRQWQAHARQHHGLDAAVARRRALLQPPARVRRHPVLRGAVSHRETHTSVPAVALRRSRVRKPLGGSLRRLVQRQAPTQRDPVRDARPAASWARTRNTQKSPRAIRTRPPYEPGALEWLYTQLVARRACR